MLNTIVKGASEQILALYEQGLSLIPVDSKTKSPALKSWKKYQQDRMLFDEVIDSLDRVKTEAVAIVCGAVSGNLECLDIDSKFKPGIDAQLFADLNKFYPHIFESLRIHKTPSGGFHLFYKVQTEAGQEVPGNRKLAGYLDENGKQVNFIETRGEGGYALAPPSGSYEVYQEAPIPVISWEERCSLIALCESYTEIIKAPKRLPVRTAKEDFYSENPWEHFTNSSQGAEVLTRNGWLTFGENATYVYYTRPGKKQGISASFNKETKIYYFFTSSTEFEPGRGYFPGAVLALLEHGGDYKAAWRWLIDNGYGKIREEREKKLVKSAAKKGYNLPANVSEAGKQAYQKIKEELQEKHPYGLFWTYTDEGKPHINRAKIYSVAEALGFRRYFKQLVRIDGYKVHLVEEDEWFNTLRDYIQEEDPEEYDIIRDAFEAFLQRAGNFSISRMADLDDSLLIRSTKTTSYKFFRNCYLEITAGLVQERLYTDIGDRLVWAKSIVNRDYVFVPDYSGSLYFQFLHNAIGVSEHLLQVLGFYAHDYKDETMGYICIMTEQVPNPEDGGGAGKNVFASLLRLTISLKSIPGSQVDWSDKILSNWEMQKIFSISDAPKNTDFAFLKDLSTGEGSWKKLYKDPVTVPCHLMPKFLISTNFSYELSDGGLKRRIIPIEFTDYYTQRGGIDVVHGCHFPEGWSDEEYHAYDNIIVSAIQAFLKTGCKLKAPELSAGGWEKQFKQAHGETTWQFIQENWAEWLKRREVPVSGFNELYNAFCEENAVKLPYRKSSTKLNRALAEWAQHNKASFVPTKEHRFKGDTKSVKCKLFIDEASTLG